MYGIMCFFGFIVVLFVLSKLFGMADRGRSSGQQSGTVDPDKDNTYNVDRSQNG